MARGAISGRRPGQFSRPHRAVVRFSQLEVESLYLILDKVIRDSQDAIAEAWSPAQLDALKRVRSKIIPMVRSTITKVHPDVIDLIWRYRRSVQ